MYVNITSNFRGKKYRFNNIFGFLRSSLSRSGGVYTLAVDDTKSEKTRRFMDLAENPYLLSPSVSKVSVDLAEIPKYLCAYAKLLVWAHKHFYPLVWCLSHLRIGYFSSAIDATDAFFMIVKGNQNEMCLPRSVFAATMSRRFKKEGAMFVGVFHPSRRLHAWVIEGDCIAYRNDSIWINFTPVSILI